MAVFSEIFMNGVIEEIILSIKKSQLDNQCNADFVEYDNEQNKLMYASFSMPFFVDRYNFCGYLIENDYRDGLILMDEFVNSVIKSKVEFRMIDHTFILINKECNMDDILFTIYFSNRLRVKFSYIKYLLVITDITFSDDISQMLHENWPRERYIAALNPSRVSFS